jgi:hypothetical protein
LKISILRASGQKNEEAYQELVALNEILEMKLVRKVVIPDLGELEYEVIWINSKINYYMKMVNHYEKLFIEDEKGLTTLDQSLQSMEGKNSLIFRTF